MCFLTEKELLKHTQNHHNPLETRNLTRVRVEPFIVTPNEEEHCVKALQAELFIANKRPNKSLNNPPQSRPLANNDNSLYCSETLQNGNETPEEASVENSTGLKQDGLAKVNEGKQGNQPITISDSDEEEFFSAEERGVVHVRGFQEANNFLKGGEPTLKVSTTRSASSSTAGLAGTAKVDTLVTCSSQRLIDYLSKLRRADGVIPNQSVILTPDKTPAKCCECLQFITTDHFVATIVCRSCKYSTNCPRAATRHNMFGHKKRVF